MRLPVVSRTESEARILRLEADLIDAAARAERAEKALRDERRARIKWWCDKTSQASKAAAEAGLQAGYLRVSFEDEMEISALLQSEVDPFRAGSAIDGIRIRGVPVRSDEGALWPEFVPI